MTKRYMLTSFALVAALLAGAQRDNSTGTTVRNPNAPAIGAKPSNSTLKRVVPMTGKTRPAHHPGTVAFRGGPPANNDCAGAITLAVNTSCVATTGDVFGATQSTAGILCNGATGTAEDDVWYKFTATATTATIEVVGSTGFDAVVDLRSGACPGTNIACADLTFDGETEVINATGLTVGATYYVRVYDWYNTAPTTTTFTICVYNTPAAPANNDCAGATVLTVNSSCVPTSGTTASATQSIAAITCATFTGDANDDVWYRFTATASTATIEVAGSAGFDAVVDLRSGACTGTNIACADATLDGGLELINASGLTVGNTYYIRVYDYETAAPTTPTFDICVYNTPAAPPNDLCGSVTPVALAIGGAVNFNGTTSGATLTNDAMVDSVLDDGVSRVWHAFTTTSCANVAVSYCGTTPAFGTVTAVLATDCPAGTVVFYSSGNFTDCVDANATLFFDDLPAGTWYLPVGLFADANGPYSIEVSALACAGSGVPNDDCAAVTPVALSIGASVTFTGDNTGAVVGGDVVPGTLLDAGGDTTTVWHAFTLADCANLTVSYCGTTTPPSWYWAVLALDCPADDDVIFLSGGNFTDCVDGNATIFFSNVPAGTYYLPVRGEPATDGPYTIEVSASSCVAAPANDDCGGAFGLAVNTTCVPTIGDVEAATESLPGINCAGAGLGNANDDVWYSFVAGTGTTHTVIVDGLGATDGIDAVVEVFSGSCAGGTSIACSDTSLTGDVESLDLPGLTPGNTYWVRVYDWYTLVPATTTFTICVVSDFGTGVQENTTGWSFFPNPTEGTITISSTSITGDATMELVDMTGRTVHAERARLAQGTSVTFDVPVDLAAGSYSLRMTSAAGTSSQPVLVK